LFEKILVANRGEIATRVMRTCREMGIRTVAVFADEDADSLHVRLADEAHRIGAGDPGQGYLRMGEIVGIAQKTGVDAIHPGYGFLAENPQFVELCEKHGLAFIGPSSASMGNAKPKNKARRLMKLIGVPVVPGSEEAIRCTDAGDLEKAVEIAEEIGWPVIVKPSGGGGGIGMRFARDREELHKAIRHACVRGERAFGISSFYIEKFLTGVKHIEFQVLADRMGNVINIGDRDCSIQRRFQKLVEETPCPVLPYLLRMKMGVAAVEIAMALKSDSLMTVEFLYSQDTREFFFNEVNCRLQVEHGITELTTGIDIVKEQIRIAAGETLPCSQEDVRFHAHAIECRITAEDPANHFLPSPGRVTRLHLPHGLGVRIDEGLTEGSEVSPHYDPMLFKILTWGRSRDEAIARMKRALRETIVEGVRTTIPFHRTALEQEHFLDGTYSTRFVKRLVGGEPAPPRRTEESFKAGEAATRTARLRLA
jgi:acetyl-CoA carboxylase biotin carboxylase subunit